MLDKEESHYVFVYGSLKRNYWNNRLLQNETFIAEGTTLFPDFKMYDGGYPVVAWDNPGNHSGAFVSGELWRVSDQGLQSCDYLEGHPSFYKRQSVPVILENDVTVNAWMYIGTGVLRGLDNRDLIEVDEQNTLIWEKDD